MHYLSTNGYLHVKKLRRAVMRRQTHLGDLTKDWLPNLLTMFHARQGRGKAGNEKSHDISRSVLKLFLH